MRLIFIRHGDPDYTIDSLTEKGKREAECLSKRIASWRNIDGIYVSPLGRAQLTAKMGLSRLGEDQLTDRFRETHPHILSDMKNGFPSETLPWLQEFNCPIEDPTTHRVKVPWDFMPEFYTKIPAFYGTEGPEKWMDVPPYNTNPDLKPTALHVFGELDALLDGYGYHRSGRLYLRDLSKTGNDENDAILFFCHFGVTALMLSHLFDIPFPLLSMNFISTPTGVTVLNNENRLGNRSIFRLQFFGDTSHLTRYGEEVSASGAFSSVFQG